MTQGQAPVGNLALFVSTMRIFRSLLGAGLLALVAACGGSSVAPSDDPPSPPPAPNDPPVIASITVQGTAGPREPAQYASLGETVNVTAVVTDTETPPAQLTYEWTSSVGGTFSGNTASVMWTAPPSAVTPADITLTLRVTERYGTNGTYRVERTSTVNLHDSAKEVGDLARQFLLDFSNQLDPDFVMRNFSPNCPGTTDERGEVIDQQARFTVLSYTVEAASTTVPFTGICPFRNRQGDACAQVPVRWEAREKSSGNVGTTSGIDQVTAVLENGRWRLCASDYNLQSSSGLRLTSMWFIR
jgi:hypothetical protein